MCRKVGYLASFGLVLVAATYACADSNLVAHYEFGAVGNFSDSVAGGAAGEPQGDARIIWDDIKGSYVLSLDGDGDYVYFGTEWNYIVETAMTVAAWIRPNSLAKWEAVASRGYAWRLKGWEDGNVAFQVMNTTPERAVGTKDVTDGVWHHVAAMYDGAAYNLYVDGRLDVSVPATGAIKPGTAYYGCIGAFYKKSDEAPKWFFDGLIDDVRIYDRVLSETEIWQLFAFEPGGASEPGPADMETDVARNVVLRWSPGDNATQHDVYFGTDFGDVNEADTSDTTGIYRGRQDANDYSPTEALEWGATYYWRIDEVNNVHPNSPWIGSIWSFTTADYLIVDDFEDYDNGDNQIWYAWKDGLGYGEPDTPPYYSGNSTGSAVGDETAGSYTEESIVQGGAHSMPYSYDNNKQGFFKYSEARMTLSYPRDWTEESIKALSLWFRGYPAYLGGFAEGPSGAYTVTGSGADIWNKSDQLHYAWKMLSGIGSIVAKVESVENTHEWAKAGVMIRETLDPNSAFAAVYITPGNGCRFQARLDTAVNAVSDSSVTTLTHIKSPHWIKLERTIAGDFNAYDSNDPSVEGWHQLAWNPQYIPMNTNVYIGLALTSHDTALACEAVFSNVTTTGNVGPQWMHQDIGIQSNDPEPMYVRVANSTGTSAVVYHNEPAAAQIDTWTEWNIDLRDFADQGINLKDVESVAIGFGDRTNPRAGGSGKMYFDDIRLYRPRYIPGLGTPLVADVDSNGVVDMADLEMMASDWLTSGPGPASDVNADGTVDFTDYAVLADQWLEEQLWPEW